MGTMRDVTPCEELPENGAVALPLGTGPQAVLGVVESCPLLSRKQLHTVVS